ncbi:hypothetical protein ACP4OV_007467 [Aristida adscensionis]
MNGDAPASRDARPPASRTALAPVAACPEPAAPPVSPSACRVSPGDQIRDPPVPRATLEKAGSPPRSGGFGSARRVEESASGDCKSRQGRRKRRRRTPPVEAATSEESSTARSTRRPGRRSWFTGPESWLEPVHVSIPISYKLVAPRIPMINPSGTSPKVTQPAQMEVSASPDNDDHEEVLEVPPPSAQEKTKKGGTRSKQGNFNPEEDVNIVKSWVEISCDPVISNSQKRSSMWDRIMVRYNLRRGSFPERSLRSIQSCWDVIKGEVAKFSFFYADIMRENPSGNSDGDMTTRAAANFASIYKRNFAFMHCWELMKDEPKWQDPKLRETTKDAGGSGFGEGETHAGGSRPGGTAGSRPVGRDSAKAAKKKANSSAGSSSSSEYAARMQDLSLQKITIMQEEATRKTERFQQLATIDEKRFEEMRKHNQTLVDIEQERIRMQREKHEREIEKEEKQEDERILVIDLNTCTPPQRAYYEALQDEIMEKIAARRKKRQAP